LGIGIAGAIPVGLFITPFATSLVLIFLVHFKNMLSNQRAKIFSSAFFWSLIFGSLIIYTHILSMVFAAFFGALILFFYLKRENLKKVIYLALSLLITGAYALYPLFAFFKFSSGWRVDSLAYFPDPILPLLGFDPSDLIRGDWLNFNWVWFFIFIFFIAGLIKLIRERQYILPTLFFVSLIVVPRDFIARIFPTLPIHYYRIMPLIFFIYLSIAVVGIQNFFVYLWRKKYEMWHLILLAAFILLLFWQIYFFSFLNSGMNIKPRIIDSYVEPIQYYENIEDYPFENRARETMKYFFDQQVQSRVVPASNGRSSMIKLGSAHYFDTLLPMVNNTPVIFGLYAESAYQVPFLFTPLEILTNLRFAYGNVVSLMGDTQYKRQTPEAVLKELSLFNAEYLIMDADYNREAFAQATGSLEKIDLANDVSPFEIYQIKDVMRDYISSPQYLPALYINEDGDLPFRNFALGWYKLIDILDFPVVFNDNQIKDINLADLDGVSFIIVHADKLSAEDIERLSVLNKSIVVLSAGKYQGAELPVNMSLIEDFIPGVGYYGKALPDIPNYEALEKLQAIFQEMK
ncbi:hypothetical protein JXE04_03545, partial [Patescibacteria group bacterium]|nr:hypothetical protein [Patescibacteria group bacterium]